MKKLKDFPPEGEESYITQEMLARAGCSPPTLIKWIQEWEVEGKPLGFKRGGRWVVNMRRLSKFLRGQGTRIKPGKGFKAKQQKHKPDCFSYNICLEAAALADSEFQCDGCSDYKKK